MLVQLRLERSPFAHSHRPGGEDVVARRPGIQSERDRLSRAVLTDRAVEWLHLLG